MTSPPSNMGWPAGYVPSASEWAESQSKKVDFPAPLDQGGTGAVDAFGSNYNIQQRVLVGTSPYNPMALTRYGVQSTLAAITLNLPELAGLDDGDWVDIIDIDGNCASNHITIAAAGGDPIIFNGVSVHSLDLTSNGCYAILMKEGSQWSMVLYTQTISMPVQENSTPVVTAKTLNFAGAGVTATDAGGGVALITIPGATGATVGVAYDGSFVMDASRLDFSGPIMSVTNGGGGHAEININTSTVPVVISGTTYTLAQTDDAQYLLCTNAAAVTITCPLNATVPIAIGTVVTVEQNGAGQVTFAPAGGVTLNSRSGAYSTAGQYAVFQVKKVDTNVWTVIGDATA